MWPHLLFITIHQTSFVPQVYQGGLVFDEQKVLSLYDRPLYKRLIKKALPFLHKASIQIDFDDKGKFVYFFEDGFDADTYRLYGKWVQTGNTLTLFVNGKKWTHLNIVRGNKLVMDPYLDFPIVYSAVLNPYR